MSDKNPQKGLKVPKKKFTPAEVNSKRVSKKTSFFHNMDSEGGGGSSQKTSKPEGGENRKSTGAKSSSQVSNQRGKESKSDHTIARNLSEGVSDFSDEDERGGVESIEDSDGNTSDGITTWSNHTKERQAENAKNVAKLLDKALTTGKNLTSDSKNTSGLPVQAALPRAHSGSGINVNEERNSIESLDDHLTSEHQGKPKDSSSSESLGDHLTSEHHGKLQGSSRESLGDQLTSEHHGKLQSSSRSSITSGPQGQETLPRVHSETRHLDNRITSTVENQGMLYPLNRHEEYIQSSSSSHHQPPPGPPGFLVPPGTIGAPGYVSQEVLNNILLTSMQQNPEMVSKALATFMTQARPQKAEDEGPLFHQDGGSDEDLSENEKESQRKRRKKEKEDAERAEKKKHAKEVKEAEEQYCKLVEAQTIEPEELTSKERAARQTKAKKSKINYLTIRRVEEFFSMDLNLLGGSWEAAVANINFYLSEKKGWLDMYEIERIAAEVLLNRNLKDKQPPYICTKTPTNGDCCFFAVARQIYGDSEHHPFLRKTVVAAMAALPDYVESLIGVLRVKPKKGVKMLDEDKENNQSLLNYLNNLSKHQFAHHTELKIMSLIYHIEFNVFNMVSATWVKIGLDMPALMTVDLVYSDQHYFIVERENALPKNLVGDANLEVGQLEFRVIKAFLTASAAIHRYMGSYAEFQQNYSDVVKVVIDYLEEGEVLGFSSALDTREVKPHTEPRWNSIRTYLSEKFMLETWVKILGGVNHLGTCEDYEVLAIMIEKFETGLASAQTRGVTGTAIGMDDFPILYGNFCLCYNVFDRAQLREDHRQVEHEQEGLENSEDNEGGKTYEGMRISGREVESAEESFATIKQKKQKMNVGVRESSKDVGFSGGGRRDVGGGGGGAGGGEKGGGKEEDTGVFKEKEGMQYTRQHKKRNQPSGGGGGGGFNDSDSEEDESELGSDEEDEREYLSDPFEDSEGEKEERLTKEQWRILFSKKGRKKSYKVSKNFKYLAKQLNKSRSENKKWKGHYFDTESNMLTRFSLANHPKEKALQDLEHNTRWSQVCLAMILADTAAVPTFMKLFSSPSSLYDPEIFGAEVYLSEKIMCCFFQSDWSSFQLSDLESVTGLGLEVNPAEIPLRYYDFMASWVEKKEVTKYTRGKLGCGSTQDLTFRVNLLVHLFTKLYGKHVGDHLKACRDKLVEESNKSAGMMDNEEFEEVLLNCLVDWGSTASNTTKAILTDIEGWEDDLSAVKKREKVRIAYKKKRLELPIDRLNPEKERCFMYRHFKQKQELIRIEQNKRDQLLYKQSRPKEASNTKGSSKRRPRGRGEGAEDVSLEEVIEDTTSKVPRGSGSKSYEEELEESVLGEGYDLDDHEDVSRVLSTGGLEQSNAKKLPAGMANRLVKKMAGDLQALRAPKDLCFASLTNQGCVTRGCKRQHASDAVIKQLKQQEEPCLEVYVMHKSGYKGQVLSPNELATKMSTAFARTQEPDYKFPTFYGREIVATKARAKGEKEKNTRKAALDWNEEDLGKPLPKGWLDLPDRHKKESLLRSVTTNLPGATLLRSVVREEGVDANDEVGGELCDFAVDSHKVWEAYLARYPDLIQLPTVWKCHLISLATSDVRSENILDPSQWLTLAVASFKRSLLHAGKDEAVNLLQKLQHGGPRAAGELAGSVHIHEEEYEGDFRKIDINGKSFTNLNCGESIGNQDQWCVLVTLAFIIEEDKESLLELVKSDAHTWKNILGEVGSKMSSHEYYVRLFVHDLECRSSQDFNLTRYFTLKGRLASQRLLILVNEGDAASLHVMQPTRWDPLAKDAKTSMIYISEDHATVITKLPKEFGGDLMKEGGGVQSIPPSHASALIHWCKTIGIKILYSESVTEDEVLQEPKELDSNCLASCPSCHQKVLLRVLASGVPRQEETRRGAARCTHIVEALVDLNSALSNRAPLNKTGEKIAFLNEDTAPPQSTIIHNGLFPRTHISYCASMAMRGNFSKRNMQVLLQHRPEEAKRWGILTMKDILDFPFPTLVKEKALKLVLTLKEGIEKVDWKKVQGGDEVEWNEVLLLINETVSTCDFLVSSLKEVLAAAAALRQAGMVARGGTMPLDSDRLRSIGGLMPEAVLETLVGIADYGVPLLMMEQRKAPEVQAENHDSAIHAWKEIARNVLVDAAEGGVLLCSEKESGENMKAAGVFYFPSGAVTKQNPDGTPSTKSRHICDARPLNQYLEDHRREQEEAINLSTPAALTPKIIDILRHISILWSLYPYCEIWGIKRDFANAFKLVHHNIADLPNLATALAGFSGLVMMYSLLVFGQTKSPAWFCLPALVVAAVHSLIHCQDKMFNGSENAYTLTHVDDALSFFRRCGNRELIIPSLYTAVAEKVFGSSAISVKKLLEEGELSQLIQAWGVIFDLREMRYSGPAGAYISIPSAKVTKLADLLTEFTMEKLINRDIDLKLHQRLQGLVVYMSICCKPLHSIMPRLFAMAATSSLTKLMPKENISLKWNDYAEAIILLKLLVADEENFVTSCTSSIAKALSPREQMELNVPRRFLGSDATGQTEHGVSGVLSAIDYGEDEWYVEEVNNYWSLLLDRPGSSKKEKNIVPIAELLPIIIMAFHNGERWGGQLVISACDNSVVVDAITKKRSENRVIQYLLDMLSRLEQKYRFQLVIMYINTKNNTLADEISRLYFILTDEELDQAVEELHPGLTRTAMLAFKDLLQERAFDRLYSRVLAGEDENSIAYTSYVEYYEGVEGKYPEDEVELSFPNVQGGIIELNAATGVFAATVARRGGTICGVIEEKQEGHAILAECFQPNKLRTEVGVGSFTKARDPELKVCALFVNPDTHGATVGDHLQDQIVMAAYWWNPKIIVIVQFSGGEVGAGALLEQRLGRHGYRRVLPLGHDSEGLPELVNLTDLGSAISTTRGVLYFEKEAMIEVLGAPEPLHLCAQIQPNLESILDKEVDPALWVSGTFKHNALLSSRSGCIRAGFIKLTKEKSKDTLTQGDKVKLENLKGSWIVLQMSTKNRVLVSPRGYSSGAKWVNESEILEVVQREIPVLSIKGKAKACVMWSKDILGLGNQFILDSRRKRSGSCVRKLSTCEIARLMGFTSDHALKFNQVAANEGWSSDERERWMIRSTPTVLAEAITNRVVERLHNFEVLYSPSERPAEVGTTRASGLNKNRDKEMTVVASSRLSKLRLSNQLGEEFFKKLQRRDKVPKEKSWDLPKKIEGPRIERPLIKKSGIEKSWKNRMHYLIDQGVSRGTKATYDSSMRVWKRWRFSRKKRSFCDPDKENLAEEICKFVTTRALDHRVVHSTISGDLSALRRYYMTKGYPNPCEGHPKLIMLMEGVKRISGAPKKKIPIPMSMIRSLAEKMDQSVWDDLVTTTAIVSIYVFLLRSGEALRKSEDPDEEKCLRGNMVIFRRKGKVVSGANILKADEVVLSLKKTKADQLGKGQYLNAFSSSDDDLCVLTLFKNMYKMNPHHFDADGDSYLFTMSDGKVLSSGIVSRLLKREAKLHGYSKLALSVISLRAGGASAMWALGFSEAEIRMRGRWASDAWKRYVWEGDNERTEIVKRLLRSDFVPITLINHDNKRHLQEEEIVSVSLKDTAIQKEKRLMYYKEVGELNTSLSSGVCRDIPCCSPLRKSVV